MSAEAIQFTGAVPHYANIVMQWPVDDDRGALWFPSGPFTRMGE
jgi:hypothetical protein